MKIKKYIELLIALICMFIGVYFYDCTKNGTQFIILDIKCKGCGRFLDSELHMQ